MLANIIEYLADTFGSQLSYIDEDFGQLEALDNEKDDTYPLTFPAVLINEEHTEWTNQADGDQIGECSLRVRLVIDCYDDTHARAPMAKEKAAERLHFVHRLHCALQGFRPDNIGNLVRFRSSASTWRHGFKIYDLFYTCTTIETTPKKATTGHPKIVLHVGGNLHT